MEPKPSATQPCLKENCIQEIGWHVGDWGLVSIHFHGSEIIDYIAVLLANKL